MRLLALAMLAVLAAGAADAGPRTIPGWSVTDLDNGVVCTVRRVNVLAQSATDCRKLGGRVAEVKWTTAAAH